MNELTRVISKPAPFMRQPELTRVVTLSAPDSEDRGGASPAQQQRVSWSGPLEALLGYQVHEIDLTEDWWLNHIHPDDVNEVSNSLRQHLRVSKGAPAASESRMWRSDYRLRRKNGDYVLVSDRSITTRDDNGNAILHTSVLFDKEKRRAEREENEARMKAQNHLATIAHNTPSGIFMMDPRGYCTYMNAAAEQITGFTYEEIYDYTFHASVHSCKQNGFPYPLHECPVFRHQQENTEAKNEAEVFVHKDGHYYDIVYSVSAVGSDYASGGAVIEFRDVTDEKRIERERMSALLENEQQSIRIKESEAHKANMTSFVSFVCHELRNPLQGVTSSAVWTEFLTETLEKLEALSSTITAQPNLAISPLVEDEGQQQHTNSSTGAAMNGGYVPAQQPSPALADTSTLVAMSSLIAYAKELVSNIATCASHQALITNNVLDLSRLDAGKVEPSSDVVDVQALGEQTVAMMHSRAQVKSINLRMANVGTLPLYIKADATILSQVLLNLISNAVKFTPDNGEIIVNLYLDHTNKSGQITLHGSVTDNGLGMTETEQQRLFQRFSQANRKVAQLYGGSGLGLSISKELVRVMGGEMKVQSTQGKGSTFSFTSLHDAVTKEELVAFLRDNDSQKESLPFRGANMVPTGNDETKKVPPFRMICVAEDNPINLKHLAKNLGILGYSYILCKNGQEALDAFIEKDSTIDAVIIDMSMPVMDGLEATRRMRAHESNKPQLDGSPPCKTPIIALSGNALKEQIDDAMASGTSDYLVKPCKRADLARTLKHWEWVVHTGARHEAAPAVGGVAVVVEPH